MTPERATVDVNAIGIGSWVKWECAACGRGPWSKWLPHGGRAFGTPTCRMHAPAIEMEIVEVTGHRDLREPGETPLEDLLSMAKERSEAKG